jgi:hypothetical protein
MFSAKCASPRWPCSLLLRFRDGAPRALLSPNYRAMPSLSEVHRLCAQILRDFCLPPLASYLVSHQERCGARQCFWACIALGPPLLPHHPSTFLRRGRRAEHPTQNIDGETRSYRPTVRVALRHGHAQAPGFPDQSVFFRLTPVRPDRRHDFPPAPYDRDAVVRRIFKAPTVQASLGALAGDRAKPCWPAFDARLQAGDIVPLYVVTTARSYVTRTPPRRIREPVMPPWGMSGNGVRFTTYRCAKCSYPHRQLLANAAMAASRVAA